MYIDKKIEKNCKDEMYNILYNLLYNNIYFKKNLNLLKLYYKLKNIFFKKYIGKNILIYFFTFFSIFYIENIKAKRYNIYNIKKQMFYLINCNFLKIIDFFYLCVIVFDPSLKIYNFKGLVKNIEKKEKQYYKPIYQIYKKLGDLKVNSSFSFIQFKDIFINFKNYIDLELFQNKNNIFFKKKYFKFFKMFSEFLDIFIEKKNRDTYYEIIDFTKHYDLYKETLNIVNNKIISNSKLLNLSINQFINNVTNSVNLFNYNVFDINLFLSKFSFNIKLNLIRLKYKKKRIKFYKLNKLIINKNFKLHSYYLDCINIFNFNILINKNIIKNLNNMLNYNKYIKVKNIYKYHILKHFEDFYLHEKYNNLFQMPVTFSNYENSFYMTSHLADKNTQDFLSYHSQYSELKKEVLNSNIFNFKYINKEDDEKNLNIIDINNDNILFKHIENNVNKNKKVFKNIDFLDKEIIFENSNIIVIDSFFN